MIVVLIVASSGTRPRLQAQRIETDGEFGSDPVQGGVRTIADEDLGPETRVVSPTMSLEATRVWVKLQDVVEVRFGDGTSLENIIKFVRESTKDSARFPKGIPVYVNPQGLRDEDKTMQSEITIELDGLPLGKTFAIALSQLGLVYTIEPAGYIEVTSSGCDESLIDPGAVMLERLASLRREIRALRMELRAGRPVDWGVGRRGAAAPPASQGPVDLR
ncbi:hypothetical protein TA3x_000928 [Tundrisphaera sp. TA3]|uniref:hypothetical protein n=1 Tax=Tundrisphaera sp. TA3 TaxID=3435775 RepID=UPI003EB87F33